MRADVTYAENLSDASDGENRAPNNSDSDSDGDLAPPPPINEAAARQQRRYSPEELLDEAEHSIEPRVALRMLNEHIQEAFDAAVQALQPAAAAADARPAAVFVRIDEEQPPDRPPPPPALQRTALSDPLEGEEPAQSPEAPSSPLGTSIMVLRLRGSCDRLLRPCPDLRQRRSSKRCSYRSLVREGLRVHCTNAHRRLQVSRRRARYCAPQSRDQQVRRGHEEISYASLESAALTLTGRQVSRRPSEWRALVDTRAWRPPCVHAL